MIDTRTWGVRTLDPHVTNAALASGTLLAFGVLWDSRSQKITGSGLSGYDPNGSRRFHLYGDDPISAVQPLGARVLVGGAAGSRLFATAQSSTHAQDANSDAPASPSSCSPATSPSGTEQP